jgi:hypothetical protein
MRFWLVVVAVLGACVSSSDPIEPQVTSGAMQKRIPLYVNRKLDVLFVIDNSPAMVPHVDNVKTNLGRLADILRAQTGGLPDLRLGVVTTDLADDAKLRGTSGLTGNFIVDLVGPDGVRLHNYDGDLADVVARLTDVGTVGADPQPLGAARRAFENPMNRSFLRTEAFTAVYFISASDTPETAFESDVEFFKTLHSDPSKIIVGGVLGDGPHLPAFLDRFPNRSVRASISEANWSSVFDIITQAYKTTLGAPCIESPLLDIDPVTAGPQYECAVWYDFPIGGKVIPPCTGTLAGECWKIVEDNVVCPTSTGIFKLEQPRGDLPDEVMLNVDCLSR